ncbi:hypothetical protein BV898_04155 [Hypsibius exemplaris]|uniref:G-protein coupled receptors family 1 profile domain-containing protein n=1 Tax=Hypsibius exemplaris TaxID=2072580 RepID=A0A1W0X376_HYPEX|nr:hypothetical protein BV898_04155 [Hypsibius exemplaris]
MNNSTVSNGTSRPLEYSWISKVFGVILIPLALGGFLGSLLCVWIICRGYNRQKTSSNLLFVNLCLATFLFCGLVCPFHIYGGIVQQAGFLARRSAFGFCNFLALTHFTTLTASAYAHSAIAVNRLFAVVVSGRLHTLGKSKWFTWFSITATWVISAATFAPPLFVVNITYGFSTESMKCTYTLTNSPTYVTMSKVINVLLPYVIMLVCYGWIFTKVWLSKHRLRGRGQRQVGGLPPAVLKVNRSVMQVEIRITKNAFITCATFFAFYLPTALYGVTGRSRQELQSTLGISLNYLWWTGCAVNPLVYAYLNSAMRGRISAWLFPDRIGPNGSST